MAIDSKYDESYYEYNQAIYEACFRSYFDAVQVLLSRGGDPNYQCAEDDNFSLLHAAACNEDVDMIALLLEFGADPDINNDHGQIPSDLTEDESICIILENASRDKLNATRRTH